MEVVQSTVHQASGPTRLWSLTIQLVSRATSSRSDQQHSHKSSFAWTPARFMVSTETAAALSIASILLVHTNISVLKLKPTESELLLPSTSKAPIREWMEPGFTQQTTDPESSIARALLDPMRSFLSARSNKLRRQRDNRSWAVVNRLR